MDFRRKSFFAVILLLLSVSFIFAQVGADVNDDFYEDAVQWEISGKIRKLPMVRPYPISLIKDILIQVMSCEDHFAAEKAAYYYRQFFADGIVRVGADASGIIAVGDYGENNKQLSVNPFVSLNAEFLEKGSVSVGLMPILTNSKRGKEVLPIGRTTRYDYESDTSSIGPINIFTSTMSMVAYGSPDVYIQAGMARSDFGNFYNDGIILNAGANQTGHISFTINKEKINFSLGMLLLTGTNALGKSVRPQKYLYFHSFRYSPIPELDLTFYETAMTGPRFDFTYLFPAALYMPIQQLIGFSSENLMMGLQVGYILRDSLRFTGDICIDDMNFNDLVRFHFDTKMKFAAQLGFQYAPTGNNMLKMLTLDYTMITPYMYTHSQYDSNDQNISYGTNYQNYTTNGKPLGLQMMPNSDRVKLSFKLEFNHNMKLTVGATIQRHTNINEALPFECVKQYLMEDESNVNTSGNIFDYPDAGNGYFSYCQHNFMFLNQRTKYVCMQNDIKFEYTWELGKRHTITAFVDWLYQYERNVGIDRNIYTGGHTEAEATEELAEQMLQEWRDSLTNKISNFLSIGVKYTY